MLYACVCNTGYNCILFVPLLLCLFLQVTSTLAGTNPLSPLPGTSLVEAESFLATSVSIFPVSVDEEM